MSKPKAKAAAKNKPAKPLARTPPPQSTAASRFAAGLLTVNDTLAALPPLTDVQRKGFEAQFSNERCDKAGVHTKAADVFHDGVAWVPILYKTLIAQPDAVRRYRVPRLVWLLECLRALATAIEEQKSVAGTVEEARKRADRAQAAAIANRDDLIEVLEILSGDNEAEQTALADAKGSTATPSTLAASLKALSTLAAGWLTHDNPVMKAMAGSVDLTKGDVDKARRSAEDLIEAAANVSAEGKREVRDAPRVNRIEGRVLLEMRLAMSVFDNANKRNKLVPKLVPGGATRAFLAPKRVDGSAASTQAAVPQGE